jgi:hypothetical protein
VNKDLLTVERDEGAVLDELLDFLAVELHDINCLLAEIALAIERLSWLGRDVDDHDRRHSRFAPGVSESVSDTGRMENSGDDHTD